MCWIWKKLKIAILYGIHSPSMKQILNSCVVQNRIIPQGWKDRTKAVLEHGSQLQWWWWWREAKAIEQRNRGRGGQYFPRSASRLRSICWGTDANQIWWGHLGIMLYSSLSIWDKVEETGERLELFTQIMLGLKETFTAFNWRLISAVDSRV